MTQPNEKKMDLIEDIVEVLFIAIALIGFVVTTYLGYGGFR